MNRIRLATAGLLVAWMTHDLEELATMSDTSRSLLPRLPDWMPLPASMRQHGLTAPPRPHSAATAPKAAQPSTRTRCSASACTGSATSP